MIIDSGLVVLIIVVVGGRLHELEPACFDGELLGQCTATLHFSKTSKTFGKQPKNKVSIF